MIWPLNKDFCLFFCEYNFILSPVEVLKASDVERDTLVDVLTSHLETAGDGEVWVGQVHPPTKNLLNLLSHPDSQYEHL